MIINTKTTGKYGQFTELWLEESDGWVYLFAKRYGYPRNEAVPIATIDEGGFVFLGGIPPELGIALGEFGAIEHHTIGQRKT